MGQGIPLAPLSLSACPDFPVVQYADDALIVMQACAKQLFFLKEILNTFCGFVWFEGQIPSISFDTYKCPCIQNGSPLSYLWLSARITSFYLSGTALGNLKAENPWLLPPHLTGGKKVGKLCKFSIFRWKINIGECCFLPTSDFLHVLAKEPLWNSVTNWQILNELSLEKLNLGLSR